MRVAAALALCLVACGEQVVDPDFELDLVRASCRRYPTRVRVNGGGIFACTLRVTASASLGCRSDGNATVSWSYASHEDFVMEVSVPNRFRRTSAGLIVAFGRTTTVIDYQYDDQGRYGRRIRSGRAGPFPGQTFDTTSFLAWDARGRPLSGRIVFATGQEELVTIAYDDTLREVVWSNGERHRMDRHGNTLIETWVFGTDTTPLEFEILGMAETCLP